MHKLQTIEFPYGGSRRCKRRALRSFWLLACLLCLALLKAQYIYRNYSTVDGLLSSTVYSCIQDSAGFMWFATDNGLCRFDGSTFYDVDMESYEQNGLTTLSLTMNRNQILAGTYGGFMAVDEDKRRMRQIGIPFENVDYEYDRLACQQGRLYYRTLDGNLIAYDLKQKTSHIIARQDNLRPCGLIKTKDGSVYFGQDGLYQIQGLKATKLDIPVLNEKAINTLSADDEDNLWVSCANMVYKLKYGRLLDSVNCDFYNKRTLYVDNSRAFGLLIYDYYGHGNKAYQQLSALINQKSSCVITSIFEDRDANLWVNTYNKGTFCILNSYVSTFSGQGDIYEASVHDVYVNDRHEAFMATSFGMVYKTATRFSRLDQADQHFYYSIEPMGDRLLMAVARLDGRKLRKVNDKALGIAYYQVSARRLCTVNDSTIAYNAWKNWIYIDHPDFRNMVLSPEASIKLDTATGRCTHIFRKDGSHLIVATTDACYLVDLQERKSSRMEQIRSKVNDMTMDRSGVIYLASEAGLYIIDKGRVHLVKEINGVQLKNLSALAIDAQKRLWIGYTKGLLLWKGRFLKKISASPFLRSSEINKLFYQKKENKLYIATNSGLSVIDIVQMEKEIARRPDVVLLKVISGDSIYSGTEPLIHMDKGRELDVYFSVVELNSPQDLYFRYSLNQGKSWAMTETRRISLRELSYGEHELNIQASKDNVNWGRKASVKLFVNYPFYATWRFWIITALLLLIVAGLVMRSGIRRIRRKAAKRLELQQKMEDLRYQALSAAVNPHFIFNTLGSIQSFVMNRDPFQASDYIAKFARLIRITLNHAGEKTISIEDEISRLSLYLELEKLRCGDKLEYSIRIDPSVNRFFHIPNMIIQPLLENAILHGIMPLRDGITGKLDVLMWQSEEQLIIQVRDNGVGISRHEYSKHGYVSIGIGNLRERLAQIKASEFSILNLRESPGAERGTLVEIRLPVPAN